MHIMILLWCIIHLFNLFSHSFVCFMHSFFPSFVFCFVNSNSSHSLSFVLSFCFFLSVIDYCGSCVDSISTCVCFRRVLSVRPSVLSPCDVSDAERSCLSITVTFRAVNNPATGCKIHRLIQSGMYTHPAAAFLPVDIGVTDLALN